jgi:hypothetical protein
MNEVPSLLVLKNDLILHLLSLVLIIEGHLNETETTTSHRYLVSHDNLVEDLSVLRKVLKKVWLYIKI